MLISRRALIAGTASFACPSPFALAQGSAPTSEIDIETDDPSRGALFREFIESPAESLLTQPGQPFVYPRSFIFPKHTLKDDKNHPRLNQKFGIDLSHYNGANFDFSTLRSASNVSFCYIKAGQGRWKDSAFGSNWKALGTLTGDAAIYRGAYFFLSSLYKGKDQGLLFVRLLGSLRSNDLPPVLDLEWDVVPGNRDQWQGHNAKSIIDQVIDCLKTIEDGTGRRPIIYTAGSWLNERISDPSQIDRLQPYSVWIADYSKSSLGVETPRDSGLNQILWQFTDRARLDGDYDYGMDASVYHGDDNAFQKDFGVSSIR